MQLSILRFKIKTNQPAFKNVKKWKTAAIHWEIHSKKGSVALAWRLKMQALPEPRVLYGWMSG